MTQQQPIITPPAPQRREPQPDDEGSSDDRDTYPMMPQRAAASEDDPQADASSPPNQTSTETDERWRQIQAQFVDDPRQSLAEAHTLVSELTQRVVDAFAKQRNELERQWSSGADVSTEELRVCLQRYKSFFARLLPAVSRLENSEESS